MHRVTNEDVRKLCEDPLSFAVVMEEDEIEHVIAVFISVLLRRKPRRGGKN